MKPEKLHKTIAPEVLDLLKPKAHKKYYLFGEVVVEPKQLWQQNLEDSFNHCNTLVFHDFKAPLSNPNVIRYVEIIKTIHSASCVWNVIKGQMKYGQVNAAVALNKASDGQVVLLNKLMADLQEIYKAIPEELKKNLQSPQEVWEKFFTKRHK